MRNSYANVEPPFAFNENRDYWYWLVPGLETILGGIETRTNVGGTIVTGLSVNDTLDSYVVGMPQVVLGHTPRRNCPRSMAIAYNKITLDSIEVHLTELATNQSSEPVVIHNGWSQPIEIAVYAFCDIDISGVPVVELFSNNLGKGPWVDTLFSDISAGIITDSSGGYCQTHTFKFNNPHNIGDNPFSTNYKSSAYLAVAIRVTKVVPTLLQTINNRTISVTLHGKSTKQTDMELNP